MATLAWPFFIVQNFLMVEAYSDLTLRLRLDPANTGSWIILRPGYFASLNGDQFLCKPLKRF